MIKKWHHVLFVFFVLFSGYVSGREQSLSNTPQPSDIATDSPSIWVRTLEGPDYGAFFDIVPTQDGNILAVGATNHLHVPLYSGDALLVKLTPEGDTLWKRTWGGEGADSS